MHKVIYRLDRGTGKTTGAILKAVAEAYNKPYVHFTVKDPDAMGLIQLRRLKEETLKTINTLGLKGFQVIVDTSRHCFSISSTEDQTDKVVVLYAGPEEHLYADDSGNMYKVRKV